MGRTMSTKTKEVITSGTQLSNPVMKHFFMLPQSCPKLARASRGSYEADGLAPISC